ncbi:MAG: FAD-dependent oxidoreductase [Gemmatimonadales bacterium]|nr:FAD-dependent oxidoreductase [Gemmatimonadales bacterium]NIN11020.1 FAD-dependent oxidoreductase [Gemmatimonadales bacterium]NIN49617.1 FAD-dependent oxidoreductase [Gemmatimonadales bacterium]NIP07081.1 FAD-dependent oxidoreductase [Gemmatimonadales bacterium]NIQ99472.1 FAD-dependent oxidoreductase [Gemmatimonadales bacterium]
MRGTRTRHVVLVGGGHSHIQVLESFATQPLPDTRLTLVVDRPIAIYSGMVPGLIGGQYRAEELEIDVAHWARRAGAQVIIARGVRIDAENRQVAVEDGPPVPYDVASFDIGSTVAGLDLPGIREHALAARPINVFTREVEKLVARARAHDPGDPFLVVVVGGGAGGIEVAFALEHRLGQEAKGQVEVLLLEGGPTILPGYPQSLVRRVQRHAQMRRIAVHCHEKVVAAERDALRLANGENLSYHALLWATGAVSHPIFRDSGLSTDERGFVRVRSTLQFEDYENLFAAGDCATLIDHPKTPKAGVYAVRQGPYLTGNIRALLAGKPLRSYTPQSDFLTLLNLGGGIALGTKWGLSVEGRWVMKLKDRIDRRFMQRFQLSRRAGPAS